MISENSQQYTKPKNRIFRLAFLFLFGLAIFLLTLNIILSFFMPKEINDNSQQLTSSKINLLFHKSVAEFYLSDDYLKKIKSPKKTEDSLLYTYRLTLPYDVPAPVFLQSVFKNFDEANVTISSVETALNKKSLLEISSGDKEKLYAEIIQDTSLHRDNGSLAFALSDYESLTKEELNKLLAEPESFAFLLEPKKESSEFTTTVLTARKEYIVELTGTSPNSEFILAENFPIVRNKLAINSLLRYYPRNNFFFVDQRSTLLSSYAYEKVRKEFARRKYNLFASNSFTNLSEIKEDELARNLFNLADNLTQGEVKLIILQANHFINSTAKIRSLKKRGIKFIPASVAVQKIKEK